MLTRIIETNSCGFDLKVKAGSNTAELREHIEDEQIANLANAYVLAHTFLGKVRKVIATTVGNFTNKARKTKTKNDKVVPDETDEVYIKRVMVDLSPEDKLAVTKAVNSALSEKGLDSLNYVIASRTAGGSLTKGLASFIKKAIAAFETSPGRYRTVYLAKGMGVEEDLEEPINDDETPEHIVKFATFLKAAADEAARKAEAELFGSDV